MGVSISISSSPSLAESIAIDSATYRALYDASIEDPASSGARKPGMGRKRHKPEEIIAKLRQVDVLTAQGTL